MRQLVLHSLKHQITAKALQHLHVNEIRDSNGRHAQTPVKQNRVFIFRSANEIDPH